MSNGTDMHSISEAIPGELLIPIHLSRCFSIGYIYTNSV